MVAVDICNLALSYLGDSATVASIDPPEGSAQAQHCARFYPMALGIMLEAHAWNFTTKREYLAIVQQDYFGWRYAYALPADCNQVLSVLPYLTYQQYPYWNQPFSAWPCGYNTLPFELQSLRTFQMERIDGKQVILSNAENAVVRYSTVATAPGMFPAFFTNALARLLASMLAGPLLKGDAGAAEGKRQYAMYRLERSEAETQDANQPMQNPQPVAPWIAGR